MCVGMCSLVNPDCGHRYFLCVIVEHKYNVYLILTPYEVHNMFVCVCLDFYINVLQCMKRDVVL